MKDILKIFEVNKINSLYITIAVKVIIILFILLLLILITKKLGEAIEKSIEKYKFDKTQFRFIKHFVSGSIYFGGTLLILSIIPPLKALSFSIFAGSGVLAIIIGFASQQAFSNIVSGIFIAIFKPFRIGDRIRIMEKETGGVVEDITLRHTIINNWENKRIIIPNSIISTEIIENSHLVEEKVCKFFEIGISYDSDIDLAMKIIKEEVFNHKDYFDNRTKEDKMKSEEPVLVKLNSFGDFSLNLKTWVWASNNLIGMNYIWDLNYSVKKRFDKEGIEIPFPYRTIVYKDASGKNGKELKRS